MPPDTNWKKSRKNQLEKSRKKQLYKADSCKLFFLVVLLMGTQQSKLEGNETTFLLTYCGIFPNPQIVIEKSIFI